MARDTGVASYKEGIVYEAKPGFARVQFEDLDGFVSAWLPLIVKKSLKDKECLTLDQGEHVACIMDEYFETGCVLGAVYSEEDTPPTSSKDKYCFNFFDGGQIEYDRASGKLTIVAKGDVDMTAGGAITAKSPVSITLDTPETVCTGDMLVKKKLTYLGGMSGQGGGAGPSAEIDGGVKVSNGSVEVPDGDVKAGDISVRDHHHDEHDDYQTSSSKA